MMKPRGISASHIYMCAAPVCLIGPATGPAAIDFVLMTYVVLEGLPMTVMALLLGTIHSQYKLTARIYKLTALVWVSGTLVIVTPLPAWYPSDQIANTIYWFRPAVALIVSCFFARLGWESRALPMRSRMLLSIGFVAVALFFATLAYSLVHSLVVQPLSRLAAATEWLAGFFTTGMVTCALLLPAVVGRILFAKEDSFRNEFSVT
jgi:hypothetical protein